MESSQTRDRSCVPWIGRWILTHCTSGKVPSLAFFSNQFTAHTFRVFLPESNPFFFPSFLHSFLPLLPPFPSSLPFSLSSFPPSLLPSPHHTHPLLLPLLCLSLLIYRASEQRVASVKSFRRPFVDLLKHFLTSGWINSFKINYFSSLINRLPNWKLVCLKIHEDFSKWLK